MRKSTKLLVALAAAGSVVAAGSAFTATSTIDDAAISVGSVVQSVSGATITNVVHSYTEATDTTTAVSAKAEQLLSTSAGVVKIGINGEALQNYIVHDDGITYRFRTATGPTQTSPGASTRQPADDDQASVTP